MKVNRRGLTVKLPILEGLVNFGSADHYVIITSGGLCRNGTALKCPWNQLKRYLSILPRLPAQ
jgi:hypothetical protein